MQINKTMVYVYRLPTNLADGYASPRLRGTLMPMRWMGA